MALTCRPVLLALALGGGALLGSAGAATPAAAHGGGAAFEVLEATEVAPGTVALRLAVRFEADGHEATGAIVDVVPTNPAGGEAATVRLAREMAAGTYAATFELDEPGSWTLEVTSSFPPGSTEIPVRVGGAGRDPAVAPAGEEQPAVTGEPPGAPEDGARPDGAPADGGSGGGGPEDGGSGQGGSELGVGGAGSGSEDGGSEDGGSDEGRSEPVGGSEPEVGGAGGGSEDGGSAEGGSEGGALEGGGSGEAGVIEEPEVGGAEGGSDATNLIVAAVSGIVGGGLGLWVSRRRTARRGAASTD